MLPATPPPEPIPVSELRVERFRENADVRSFGCGNRDPDEFLTTEEVARYEREKLGNTYLVYWQAEGRPVGYFTISSESLRLEYLHSVKSFSIPGEIRVSAIPGVKIGRLATDRRYTKRDVGGHMLRYIAGLALGNAAAAREFLDREYGADARVIRAEFPKRRGTPHTI